MFKKIAIFFTTVLMTLAFTSVAFAKVTPKPTPSPSPTPIPVVDSFALFWPMVAGKTMQSKVYFLKLWEEDLRGFLIFGSAQKADNDVFLSTKRMLEAEVLMKGNVSDLANKTLDSANTDLDKANSALTDAKNSGDIDQTTKDELNMRVDNLKKFVNSLMVQYPDYKTKLQSAFEKLSTLTV